LEHLQKEASLFRNVEEGLLVGDVIANQKGVLVRHGILICKVGPHVLHLQSNFPATSPILLQHVHDLGVLVNYCLFVGVGVGLAVHESRNKASFSNFRIP
jgi:hypothetical protein